MPLVSSRLTGKARRGAPSQETCLRPPNETLEERVDMQREVVRSGRRAAAAAVLVLVGALAAPAAAGAVAVNLHVEAGGNALAPGTGQVTRTISATTAKNASCHGSGNTATVRGATPLGALIAATSWDAGLRPLEVSDEFSFGLFVCSIGGFAGSSDAFWLYKVNHVSPEIGSDAFRVRTGDDVLWFFENTKTGENTGDELVTDAPARARPGDPVEVTVTAFDFAGTRKPAAGATVAASGGADAVTNASGQASVVFDREGY